MRFNLAALLAIAGIAATNQARAQGIPLTEPLANNVTFTLRYVPGFFKQGTPSVDRPLSNPEHLGLLPNVTWADVDSYMEVRASQGVATKLLLFLRHGQGIHNAAESKYGTKAWNNYYRKLPKYTDAPLTATGMEQAANASVRLDAELENGLNIQEVVVSPLERTLNTSMIAYRHHEEIPKRSIEWPRETFGICTCDLRGTISYKAVQYPSIAFGDFWSDSDPWWTVDQRESELHIDNRARTFLNHVFYDHESSHIGVVSHGGLTSSAMRVIGHRTYDITTGEILPFLVEDTANSLVATIE
ncbi:hypothetical protein BBJ28_00016593 [Nothophytophthora sp. Chile5]|nr:hypothetical protein BBJ28_00016593 [Nothophytophthora sp. Chile5]